MQNNYKDTEAVRIVGAGLSGSECALSLARMGIAVKLYEMRPLKMTEAHKTGLPAELVCSNSFKSKKEESAAGQLKTELKLLNSSLLALMYEHEVPAGAALAVDRHGFSQAVQKKLEAHPLIEYCTEEITELDEVHDWIICAGPLASQSLMKSLSTYIGSEHLYFYDAAAPIVETASLRMEKLFAESRYGHGGNDYLNAGFSKEEYEQFYEALISAERVIAKDFEQKELFQACQPVEEIARTHKDALRFGALKPVGLIDPVTGRRPWAVVQLRAENREKTAYNLVGFQTNLKFSEQKRVFSLIPGLEGAEFSRYGVMHRNSYINAPRLLDETFSLKTQRTISFAGQITGTEGYTEAVASGLFAAYNYYAKRKGLEPCLLPATSVFGALLSYIFTFEGKDYQPMHVNFGIMPPLDSKIKNKKERYAAYVARAYEDLSSYISSRPDLFKESFNE